MFASSLSSSTSFASTSWTSSAPDFCELSDCEVYNEADLCEEVEVGSVENCNNINELKKPLITTKTVKGKPKLCHGGYYYTVDRVGKNEKIQWKCERACNTQDHARCNGRASSYGYFEPVEIITEHNHIPEPERTAGLLALEEMLQRAKISSDNPRTIMKKSQLQVPTESAPFLCRPANIRQRINRLRRKDIDHGENPSNRSGIRINEELRFTLDGELFLWYDDNEEDGCDCDTHSLLIFATEKNFVILNSNPHWYGDGTFDVAPLLFKQMYTINVIESGKNLPLIYALLPDKKGIIKNILNLII